VSSAQTVGLTFAQLGLPRRIVAGLSSSGFHEPSPIQAHAIPLCRFGADVIAQAKSGTGKTCVFCVALLCAIDIKTTTTTTTTKQTKKSKNNKRRRRRVKPKMSNTMSKLFGTSASTTTEAILKREAAERARLRARRAPQALVMAPTREIALQSARVMRDIGRAYGDALHVLTCIGGVPMQHDTAALLGDKEEEEEEEADDDDNAMPPPQIVVGTPGRLRALIACGALRCDALRVVCLDEADQLFTGDFRDEVAWLLQRMRTPETRQTLMFSATFTDAVLRDVVRFMRPEPQFVLLSADAPSLQGVRQYYVAVGGGGGGDGGDHVSVFRRKVHVLLQLLARVSFHQCVVFSNSTGNAAELVDALNARGWPADCIGGHLSQPQRTRAMQRLRSFKSRVLVSTDLTARGIDVERVTLVINL
jgi:ATP-dependent RNA helicase DDX20